ncbi:MAG: DUF2306 domain-containing protein [Kangiellaceae bacterium]|nr:DUF2306 domain-containing protein [Kangiellaceae bacterium]
MLIYSSVTTTEINSNMYNKYTSYAATLWFLIVLVGQWIFGYYILMYFLIPSLSEGIQYLQNTHLPKSYIEGDLKGNISIAAHLFLSAAFLFMGPLQLIPQVRKKFPSFHRWNGRFYILLACLIALSGIYLVIFRGAVGGTVQHISILINGILILIFAGSALYFAIKRKIQIHRRWALRLFLAASGVWFARLGLQLWLFIHDGKAVGFDWETFTGPFLYFLGFAQYLLPLAILELYFYSQKAQKPYIQIFTTGVLIIASVITAIGIYAASTGMWLNRV